MTKNEPTTTREIFPRGFRARDLAKPPHFAAPNRLHPSTFARRFTKKLLASFVGSPAFFSDNTRFSSSFSQTLFRVE